MNSFNFRHGIVFEKYRNSVIKEVFRKSIHICSSFIPSLLAVSFWPVIIFLSVTLVCYCISEILRIKGIEVPFIARITEIAARKRDENKFVLGPVTLVIGIISAALLWTPEAARIGIYALAFGDGLASLSGRLFGRVYVPLTGNKTVAGSLTCFFAVFVSSFLVCGSSLTAFILAAVAMSVEVLPIKDFDNILIPVLIGGLAQSLIP